MVTEEIIKKAQAGNSEAFSIIYNETVKTAYYVAKRILISEEATEDVLQEAYIAVFQHLPEYRFGSLQGWVDTIVANRAKNYLRKKNPILFSEMETEERPVVEFEEEKIEFRPDAKIDYNETQRLILEIIDNLSPEQRLSVILFYFENRSVKEIAEICECSENTVKSRLNYARKKIKEDVLELEKKGTKLYGISIMPFIMWMLTEKAKAAEIPGELATKVLASTGTTVGATTSTVGAVVATKACMALGTKIILGVAAISVAAGVVIGAIAMKNDDGSKEDINATSKPQNEIVDNDPDTENNDDIEDINDIVPSEPEVDVESEGITQEGEIMEVSTKEECIEGIKKAAEAHKQGDKLIIRCDNKELTVDTSKSMSIVYRWLLEEELYYNVYCMYDNNEYVDIHVDSNPYPHHVIAVSNIKNAPAKIKEYLNELENPVDEMIEVWCLNSEFNMSNELGEEVIEDSLSYLDENIYLCEYTATVQGGGYVGGFEYEGIDRFGCCVRSTSRVYSVSELAEYIRNKINTTQDWYVSLDVYLYSDSIGEANYKEIINTMIEKEGFGDSYKYREKYVRDGVVYIR